MTSIPRWGRVTANANEFLIQMRRGRVIHSGQGLSCFKWPWDSVAVVPTSIAKLTFSADQVTVEKVGVEVRGLAVYRIADPLLAFRMIDGDRSSLTEILRDMFVGATRRIVARLTLDELAAQRLEAELARQRRKAEADRERAAIELEAKREAGETDAALLRLERAAHEDLSEARLREVLLTETMPEVARAFRGSFDRVNVTSTNGSEMFGFLSAGLDQVLSVARDHDKR